MHASHWLYDHPELPFHAGETAVQEHAGVRERIEPFAARVVRPYLTDQLREFFAQLPFIVAAARDGAGRVWATLLPQDEGATFSPMPELLTMGAAPVPGEALEGHLGDDVDIGLLGIDPATRRRNRVNGRLQSTEDGRRQLAVGQAFGNCPQYIVERRWYPVPDGLRSPRVTRRDALTADDRRWIGEADTLFIASGVEATALADGHAPPSGTADPRAGLDASHRGGSAGFVVVDDDGRLLIPDYAGNNHYNTIGNLVLDPRIGVTFVDFVSGSLLQLSGRAEIDLDPEPDPRLPGALRVIRMTIEAVVRLDDALPMRWRETGAAVREYRVAARIRESADVTSFYLVGRDDGPAPDFRAGQHLPLQFSVAQPNGTSTVKRSYSLSGPPGADALRISVKRDARGLVSRNLHDGFEVGDGVLASTPAGDFHVVPGERPVALLAAGIGVTPLLSMFHELTDAADPRTLLFAHGVRDAAQRPFTEEVASLVARHPDARALVAYSREAPAAAPEPGSRTAHRTGRLGLTDVQDALGTLDADFYLCGPAGFVAELTAALEDAGVDAAQIRSEQF